MPISDDQRQRIIDLHGQGLSRNDIARQTGVSAGSVTNVCKQNDLSFDRSGTEKATKSKQADDKAMRALIASDALNVVQSVSKILAHRLATNPDEIAIRDLITMYGVLTDKHAVLTKLDIGNQDHSAVDKWLDYITGGVSGDAAAGGEVPPGVGEPVNVNPSL